MFYDDWMVSLFFGLLFTALLVSGFFIYRYSDAKPIVRHILPQSPQSPHAKVIPEENEQGVYLSTTAHP